MSETFDVLPAAHHVVQHARDVHIDQAAVRRWAGLRAAQDFPRPRLPVELSFPGDRASCANLALLLSSLNFCFWAERPWVVRFAGKAWTRTYAMIAAILRAVHEDRTWIECRRWMDADHHTLAHLFRGDGEIPLLPQRLQILNETGRILLETFDGQCIHLIEQANAQAPHLARCLADHFPSYRDLARYGGREIPILKRAQIFAADVERLWQDNSHPTLAGMDQLTLFADYRIPQYLRHEGLIHLTPALAERIEAHEELASGTPEEIELRLATIWCGELICRALPPAVPAWRLDHYLWRQARSQPMRCADHRTRTVFY